jgi:hypothetical protein
MVRSAYGWTETSEGVGLHMVIVASLLAWFVIGLGVAVFFGLMAHQPSAQTQEAPSPRSLLLARRTSGYRQRVAARPTDPRAR